MRRALWVCALIGILAAMPSLSQAATRSATATLSRELEQVKLDAIPLGDAISLLADSTEGNFHVNWKALQAAGVDRTTPITIHLRHVTVRKTLSLMVEQLPATSPLSFFNDQGVIEVTTLALADLAVVTKVYHVEDLLIIAPHIDPSSVSSFGQTSGSGSGSSSSGSNSASNSRSSGQGSQRSSSSGSRSGSQRSGAGTSSSSSGNTGSGTGTGINMETREDRLTAIVELIRDTVEPTIWKENGGTASISSFDGNLIITAPRRIHERIGGAIE